MATKTKKAAANDDTAVLDRPSKPPANKSDAPAVQAGPHPYITEYRDVWVFRQGVALVNGATGFLTVLAADAATMIAADQAVDPYTTELPYIDSDYAPTTPVVVAITAFSATNPTIATASTADCAKLANGDVLKLTATGGDPAAMARIDGRSGTVAAHGAINFDLEGIDLTGEVVAGLTATGTVQ